MCASVHVCVLGLLSVHYTKAGFCAVLCPRLSQSCPGIMNYTGCHGGAQCVSASEMDSILAQITSQIPFKWQSQAARPALLVPAHMFLYHNWALTCSFFSGHSIKALGQNTREEHKRGQCTVCMTEIDPVFTSVNSTSCFSAIYQFSQHSVCSALCASLFLGRAITK